MAQCVIALGPSANCGASMKNTLPPSDNRSWHDYKERKHIFLGALGYPDPLILCNLRYRVEHLALDWL